MRDVADMPLDGGTALFNGTVAVEEMHWVCVAYSYQENTADRML